MKRKYEPTNSILFCGHSSWCDDYQTTIIPENTQLFIYAPLGSALSMHVVRAIAAGELIKKGDLQNRRISPLTLFNLGYEDTGEGVGQFQPQVLVDYPLCLNPGDEIADYRMYSPGKGALNSTPGGINILNIDAPEGIFLSELLQQHQGNTCHFGGCSWVTSEFEKRNIVVLANPVLAEKYKDAELTNEEKRAQRKHRFR